MEHFIRKRGINNMMASVINGAGSVSVQAALLCTCVSLVLGLVIAAVYMLQGEYTKNFVVTLLLLPALVQAVIMLVNGNLGTGVAIMGAFSLVRFRSVPGTSREISGVFYAIVVGLATGMGYLAYAGDDHCDRGSCDAGFLQGGRTCRRAAASPADRDLGGS